MRWSVVRRVTNSHFEWVQLIFRIHKSNHIEFSEYPGFEFISIVFRVFRFCFNQSKWIEKGSKNKIKTGDSVSTCSFMVIIVAIMYPALDAWRVAKLTQIINCWTKYSSRANTKTFITFLLSIDLIWEKRVMPNVLDYNSRVEYFDP